jgi:lipopolysaccharide transport system ATP-binding protein
MNEIAIRVSNLSKCYHIYDKPNDRLKQFVIPKLCKALPPLRRFFPTPDLPLPTYHREFWALKDVSFEIKKGETVGIIGRNGSGKSTLLQMICGTLNPTSGSVQTNGRIAALLELGSGFNPEFTGRENVYMNGAVLGLSKEEIDERFEAIATFADIGEFIEQPVKTYSSGMMVRLAFAVSVSVEPDILVVDEALAVGDAAFQFKCLDRLKLLTQSGTTLLFVSHDVHMVKSFCSRAIYLHGGEVKAIGMAEHLAELYIMNIRDEQQKQLASNAARVAPKTFVGNRTGIAFGTSQGRIVRAEFLETGLMQAAFVGDESACISIDAEYESNLPNPHISIVLQNQKMVELGGRAFSIVSNVTEGCISKAHLTCSLPIIFGAGSYYITVKLETRSSEMVFFPIDKQVGVLSFDVTRPRLSFLGSVDIGLVQLNE